MKINDTVTIRSLPDNSPGPTVGMCGIVEEIEGDRCYFVYLNSLGRNMGAGWLSKESLRPYNQEWIELAKTRFLDNRRRAYREFVERNERIRKEYAEVAKRHNITLEVLLEIKKDLDLIC